ncbi:hypothetical protein PHJA_002675100 [Phtheirospermum japonicum]|uniref:Uncharacterized protein n=1 Tax=Phtheirospermum japonicum TaxID=374723 RepID=A0A830D247_9LAMI|nr:hypothetical protein PHJA_002675100 [Phtheirospermum japonicum]
MSGPPMVKSMSFTEPEARPVLGPTGNKASTVELRKPVQKLKSEKTEKLPVADEAKGNKTPATFPEKLPSPVGFRRNSSSAASILRQRPPNMSLNASCSSDASTDSSHSRASTGRIIRRSPGSAPCLKKKQQCSPKGERIEKLEGSGKSVGNECDGVVMDGSLVKKRCAWVTSNTGGTIFPRTRPAQWRWNHQAQKPRGEFIHPILFSSALCWRLLVLVLFSWRLRDVGEKEELRIRVQYVVGTSERLISLFRKKVARRASMTPRVVGWPVGSHIPCRQQLISSSCY